MYQKLLSKSFFRNNPVEEWSAQRIIYSLLLDDVIVPLAEDVAMAGFDATRKQAIETEREQIIAEDDPRALLRWLRKSVDPVNRPVLREQALLYQDTVMPQVVAMLRTSLNDFFIETGIFLLVDCEHNYVGDLLAMYDSIRSPYTQSLICLVIGMRGEESVIPWMMEQYKTMRGKYLEENYAQGPLLALSELDARFYENE